MSHPTYVSINKRVCTFLRVLRRSVLPCTAITFHMSTDKYNTASQTIYCSPVTGWAGLPGSSGCRVVQVEGRPLVQGSLTPCVCVCVCVRARAWISQNFIAQLSYTVNLEDCIHKIMGKRMRSFLHLKSRSLSYFIHRETSLASMLETNVGMYCKPMKATLCKVTSNAYVRYYHTLLQSQPPVLLLWLMPPLYCCQIAVCHLLQADVLLKFM